MPPDLERGDWSPEPEPDTALFEVGPYILLGQPGTAFVALKADGIPAPSVEWWVAPSGEPVAPQVRAARPVVRTITARRYQDLWVARLDDLPTGPRITYRVRSAAGESPEHRFRAGAPAGARFRFVVFGDTRNGHSVHRQIVEAVEREEVDFMINTGDLVERGGKKPDWLRFFQIERPLLVKTPLVPAVGNHDVSGRDYFRRYLLHALWSDSRHYYTRDWGDLRVLVLDSGIELRRGSEQYAFAERALSEGARAGKLMAMMLHYPPYSSGEHGSILEVQAPVGELARRYGVELVVAGHDHNYERTRPIDGTTYVVSGSAGAPIRPVRPRWFTAEARTEPHYVLVDVDGRRLILRAVNLQGETFDTQVLHDLAPAQRQRAR